MTAERPSSPEAIRATHDASQFDCGVPPLDDWLKRRALANEASGASRTFVTGLSHRIVGYYSLAAASILHDVATSKARRNMPDPLPAILLGRLAVDRSQHGRGLGASLLRDAVLRIAASAQVIGVRALLVHAISDEAKAFYERFGFRAPPIEPMTLMITIDELQAIVRSVFAC